MPARLRWYASASVYVVPRTTSSVNGMLSFRVVQELEQLCAQRRSAREHRPAAHLHLAGLLDIGFRDVAGVGDVDRDRDVRADAIRRRARAGEVADLLPHGGHGDYLARDAACLGDQAGG